jgi:hypothetical protein
MDKQPTAAGADPKPSIVGAPFWAVFGTLQALMALDAPAERYWQLITVAAGFLLGRMVLELKVGATRASPFTGEFWAMVAAYLAQISGQVPNAAGWPLTCLVLAFIAERTGRKVLGRRSLEEEAAEVANISKAAGAGMALASLALAVFTVGGCQALETWNEELPPPASTAPAGPDVNTGAPDATGANSEAPAGQDAGAPVGSGPVPPVEPPQTPPPKGPTWGEWISGAGQTIAIATGHPELVMPIGAAAGAIGAAAAAWAAGRKRARPKPVAG